MVKASSRVVARVPYSSPEAEPNLPEHYLQPGPHGGWGPPDHGMKGWGPPDHGMKGWGPPDPVLLGTE